MYLSIYLSIYLSVEVQRGNLSIYVNYPYIYLSIYLGTVEVQRGNLKRAIALFGKAIYLSICLYVYLSFYLSRDCGGAAR